MWSLNRLVMNLLFLLDLNEVVVMKLPLHHISNTIERKLKKIIIDVCFIFTES